MNWQMPAEWQPHERTWMAWPSASYAAGNVPEIESAYRAWAEVVVDWMSGEGPQMMFWIRDAEQRKQAQITW